MRNLLLAGRISIAVDMLCPRIDLCQYVVVRRTVEPIADCCVPIFFAQLDQVRAERMAAALRVLADPARLRILNLIANHPECEVCQAQFTGPLGLSQPTVSHHLRVLHEAGLLRRRQRGSWAYYSLEPGHISSLLEALSPPGRASTSSAGLAPAHDVGSRPPSVSQ